MNGIDHESYMEASKPLLEANGLSTKTPFLRMLCFGSIVAAPYILAGMSLTFSSVALPQMEVNLDEASWFGSLNAFGSLFGSVFLGYGIDKYGRRPSMILSIIPAVIGWTLLAIDYNITLSFLGQFLAGIISGCIFIGIVYASESIVVNHHHLRNSFSTWTLIALAFGGLLNYILARLMPFQQIASVAAAVAFILLLCICVFIPESPRWLFEKGQIRRAKISEQRLSIHQPVLKDVEHDTIVEFDLQQTWQNLKNVWKTVKRKDVYKPLVLTTVWSVFTILAGGDCISAYLMNIITNYPVTSTTNGFDQFPKEKNTLNDYNLGIVSGVLNLIAVVLTSLLVTHLGTKKMFSIASFGLAFGMLGLGVSLSLGAKYQETQFWRVTHVISVWMIPFFNILGVISVTTTVSSEIFPSDARGFAGVPSIILSLMAAVLLKLHLYFYNCLGPLLYFIYAAINLWNIIFVAIFVHETVGKTNEEIGQHFLK